MAIPVTFPELRDRFTKAATIPCLLESAALNMEAELGDWKQAGTDALDQYSHENQYHGRRNGERRERK